MTSDTSLRKKDLICPECGSIICGTSYTYHPESKIVPYLNFQQEGERAISHEVTNDLILTRNDRGFIILQDAKMPSIMERLPIRTHYVSQPHLEISVENRLRKLDCQVKDANSQNGTLVNDTRLKIDEQCQLKHNDVITLAPNCSGYVKIVFKQRHLT